MATFGKRFLITHVLPGLDVAAVAILLLLSNKEAKAHAVKKFSWLRICKNKTEEDRLFELVAVVGENRGDGVDKAGTKGVAVKKFAVEKTQIREARREEAEVEESE